MKKAKFLLLAGALAMSCIMLLQGCGGGGWTHKDFDFTVGDPAALSGEISVMFQQTADKRNMMTAQINKYKQRAPNVTIKPIWITNDDFYLSYLTDITTGKTFPDAAIIDHIYVQSLAAENLIVSVSSVFEKDLYLGTVDKLGLYDGRYYGFPTTLNNMALFYNKDIIGETPPSTWNEFKDVCAKVKSEQDLKSNPANRYYAFTQYLGSNTRLFGPTMLCSWVARHGGTLLSEDLKTSHINTQPVIDSLSKMREISANGWANPDTNEEGLFYEGKVGMIEIGSWIIPRVFKASPAANFGIAPLIKMTENGSRSSVMGAYNMVVTRQKDENKMKIAADFAKFISEDPAFQHNWAKNEMVLPVVKAALEVDDFFTGDMWEPFLAGMEGCSFRPGSPEWPYIEMETANAISQACNGTKTPADAAKDTSNLVQKKLNDFYS